MTDDAHATRTDLGKRLTAEVLEPLKSAFVGKDEIIDVMGVCLVAGENLFILGPPGTAKSALVQVLSQQIKGRVFDYLLTRFTEPNELFGPFDIRKLREGELVTNTEGMLPEASFIFLDELLNANSAILNSLLLVLNERIFRRGRETRKLPVLMVVGASNRLPEDDALAALFDRFLLRVHCDNVETEQLHDVLVAGWRMDQKTQAAATLTTDDIRQMQQLIGTADLSQLRPKYVETIQRLRHAGIPISDRRAVKLQRLVVASALICGRSEANVSDLWILRYIWDNEEQAEVLATLVGEILEQADESEVTDSHPRSHGRDTPNPEKLAHDLERLGERLAEATEHTERSYLTDQLSILASRVKWVQDEQQRGFLDDQIESLWKRTP